MAASLSRRRFPPLWTVEDIARGVRRDRQRRAEAGLCLFRG